MYVNLNIFFIISTKCKRNVDKNFNKIELKINNLFLQNFKSYLKY